MGAEGREVSSSLLGSQVLLAAVLPTQHTLMLPFQGGELGLKTKLQNIRAPEKYYLRTFIKLGSLLITPNKIGLLSLRRKENRMLVEATSPCHRASSRFPST